jgi:hypothetical protein
MAPKDQRYDAPDLVFGEVSDLFDAISHVEADKDPMTLVKTLRRIGNEVVAEKMRMEKEHLAERGAAKAARVKGGEKSACMTRQEWALVVQERKARIKRLNLAADKVSVQLAAELRRGQFDGIQREIDVKPETIRKKDLGKR